MPEKKKQYLSASRIKTLNSCSWLYYVNYILGIRDDGNDGSRMGSVCHIILEMLGDKRHIKHYYDILAAESTRASEAIWRLVEKHVKKEGLNESHYDLLDSMILEGLKYDFFGEEYGTPTESYSEIDFDLEGDGYRILGFIDKLFLFKEKGIALVRDFKSSKRQFEGKDVYDNIQDLFYRLAIGKLFPEYETKELEFVFLQYDCAGSGVIKTPQVCETEIAGFEHYLKDIQKIVDNFDEESALSNLAYDKGFPSKEDGFSGRIMCGMGREEGQLKKDGTLMWACGQRWAYDYWVLLDENNNIVKTSKTDVLVAKEGHKVEKRRYKGCPKFNFEPNNSLDEFDDL